jgi:hypothetical protein
MPARKHGVSHGREHWLRPRSYIKWIEMRRRVAHPERRGNKCYENTEIVPRWNEYENFVADMGEPPEGLSLDRIKNELPYGPDNCRWANAAIQSANRHWVVPPIGRAYARGMKGLMSQTEIAMVLGCSQMTVSNIMRGVGELDWRT